MEKRIGVIGIILDNTGLASSVNEILHLYSDIIVARMGLPYRDRNISVISIIVDGRIEEINALTGKLGSISGINVKAAISKK